MIIKTYDAPPRFGLRILEYVLYHSTAFPDSAIEVAVIWPDAEHPNSSDI